MSIGKTGALVAGMALAAMSLIGTGAAWSAEKTSVKITSPKSGAVVHDPFMIRYIYHKGPRANHVHVYVDGTLLKPTHDNPIRMDIPKGKHVIVLKAATRHHHLLGPKSRVTVTVQ